MSYRVIDVKRTTKAPNALDLARFQGERLRDHLRDALEHGYHPATGEPRERKGDGKPLGFDDGVLARGLVVKNIGAAKGKARVRIDPPASRRMLLDVRADGQSFIERHEIITTQGVAGDVIRKATAEYMKALRP